MLERESSGDYRRQGANPPDAANVVLSRVGLEERMSPWAASKGPQVSPEAS